MTPQPPTALTRYGTPGQIAGSVVMLAGLLLLAALTGLSSIYFALSSTLCSSDDTGLLCSGLGENLALYVPAGAAGLAALLGMAGTVIGRPYRMPLLATGYALTVVGFLTGLLIAMTGPAS